MSCSMKVALCRAMLICGCALMLSWPAPTLAQQSARDDEDVAKALFQAGKAAYEAGKYADALKYFEQAYEQSQRPRMLYNVGQAADRARNDERALEAFRRFLELLPDDEHVPEVQLRVVALERSVAERSAAQSGATTHDPDSAAALSPVAVASAAPHDAEASAYDPALDGPSDQAPESDSLFGQWWFWTVTGVVVAGGATALVFALSGDAAEPKPIPGEVGGVVQTLGRF
jgi:tetratricopeptide (TPR) repeat protein